jgi:glycosyltransferase involved in cell wall biosynthesis
LDLLQFFHFVDVSRSQEHSDFQFVNIEFIGTITREQVYEYYSRSVLIFPSYIETFGLPMLEAKMHKTPMLVSDCPFSHEILDEYENVKFFRTEDETQLAGLMEKWLL